MREASRRPRVIAVETGDQTPSLSMLSVGTPPDFECPGSQVPEIFFPRKKDSDYTQARTLCAACPVLDRCRTWGDINERYIAKASIFGMLGGETPRERIVRRTLNAPNTPTYSDLRKCSECETPIRPANTLIRDFPGTKSYGAYGLCGTCYHHARKAVAA